VETIIANAPLPKNAKAWLLAHPDYITDPAKNKQMQELHYVAKWQGGGEEFTDGYFKKMEELLGIVPQLEQPPMSEQRRIIPSFASEPRPAAPAPRPAPRQVTVSPVSAPPSREVYSSNGRRLSNQSVRLSPDQREIAASIAASKGITQEEAEREYAANILRYQKLKASGAMQDG
jgi:hypothetical protein